MRRPGVPWWAKILAKIVLSRVPLRYHFWHRSGIFVHGQMDAPEYAWRVLREHVARVGVQDLRNLSVLELGPGDSVTTAVNARTLGASRVWLVDAGPFARRDVEPYRRACDTLRAAGFAPPDLDGARSLEDVLERCGAVYLTEGLRSLRQIPSGTVDLVFSQAVLEHVRRREFVETVAELHRILVQNGVNSHQVDLKDHLGGHLNNLRFDERIWESAFMARSGFYTNRLRLPEILEAFAAAGFTFALSGLKRWDRLPIPRSRLSRSFERFSDDDLCVSQFDIVARRA